MRSVRSLLISLLFLMSFCAYAGSCTPFEEALQSNPAQLAADFSVVKSDAEQQGSIPKNVISQDNSQLKHSPVKQNITTGKQAANTQIKLLSQKFPAPKQQQKLKGGVHVDPGLNRDAYLLSDYQRQPLYQLEIEFNPPLPPTQKSTPSFAANDFRPWFLSTSSSCPARIAGWKESNSLYSGSITYHS